MSSFLNQALMGGGSMLVRCSAMVGNDNYCIIHAVPHEH
jgi:hypothetical protein